VPRLEQEIRDLCPNTVPKKRIYWYGEKMLLPKLRVLLDVNG
jgi:hypothetical protein